MDSTIIFPNLGITLNPGKYITIFGFNIAYYGIVITLGMICGAIFAYHEAKRTHQNEEDYVDFTLWTLVMALIGARLYYVIFEWDYYVKRPLEIFDIRGGGLAIYGGVIASIITLIVFTKVKKLSFWLMADTAVQGLIIGQIMGRFGNFFNRECFGGYTDNLFAMQLPVSVANGITEELLSKAVMVDGVEFIQVHPTFLYESLWNLALIIGICIYKRHKKFDGEIFAIYLAGYGIGRFFIEGLRTDQLVMKHLGGIAVSQVVAIISVIFAVAFIIFNRVRLAKKTK